MTTFAKIAKAVINYAKEGLTSFLLRQSGDYLLLEHGGKIIIDHQVGGKVRPDYSKLPK